MGKSQVRPDNDAHLMDAPKFFARVVDGFLVPATAEPLIACNIAGSAEFEEREIGGRWRSYRVRSGDLFVTCSKTPYE